MTQYFICRKITKPAAHDGATGYEYYEPVKPECEKELCEEIISDYENFLFRRLLKRGTLINMINHPANAGAIFGIKYAIEYLLPEISKRGP